MNSALRSLSRSAVRSCWSICGGACNWGSRKCRTTRTAAALLIPVARGSPLICRARQWDSPSNWRTRGIYPSSWRCRALLGADADPCSGDEYLAKSQALKAMIAANPACDRLVVWTLMSWRSVPCSASKSPPLQRRLLRPGASSQRSAEAEVEANSSNGSGLSGARVGGTKHQMVTFPTC